MMKYVAFMGASVIALGLTGPVHAQEATDVVATVGGTEITLGEMIIIRAQLPREYEQFPDDVLFEGILDQLIQQQLLTDSLSDQPLRVTLALTNERRSLMAGEKITELVAQEVTDEAIAAAYAEMLDGTEGETEWNASHLLVETQEEAVAAQERVNGGEEFADVARDVSTGPSGPSGGELGWFSTGMMVPEFEDAVKMMEAGDVSDPVQTTFGWHIVTLNDVRVKELPGLEDMRAELATELRQTVIDTKIEELRDATEIVMPEDGAFDPAILTNLDLLEP